MLKAIVQHAHEKAKSVLRYDHFSNFFVAHGYVIYSNEHRDSQRLYLEANNLLNYEKMYVRKYANKSNTEKYMKEDKSGSERGIVMTKPTIYRIISSARERMSKSQHKIADYILENPHSIPFITGAKLAELTGVSEATVVRFATFLGYEGYNDLQKQLATSMERQLNTVERLTMSKSVYSETERAVYDNFNEDIKNIQTTMQYLNIDDLERAASYIIEAEKIYIIANRSALSLGTFLQYYFNIIFGKSELVHTTEAVFDQIQDVNERDVVIGISYARYTKSTLNAVSYASEKNATIIALTDHFSSPITAYANIALFATSNMQSFLDSFVAPLSVINTLIAYIGNKKQANIEQRLQNFEQLWDRYDVFY